MRIGRIDVADARRPRRARSAQLEQLLDFCLDHLRHENDFVHTAIEARQPAGSRRIADEHVEHVEIDRRAAATRPRRCATRAGARRRSPGAAPVPPPRALRRRELPAHARRGDGAQRAALAALQRRRAGRAARPPDGEPSRPQEHLLVARWMLPASTPAERARMVGGPRPQMPPEALLGVMRDASARTSTTPAGPSSPPRSASIRASAAADAEPSNDTRESRENCHEEVDRAQRRRR